MLQLSLTEHEMTRLTVIRRTFSGLSARAASQMLSLSLRQVFRLKAKVRTQGDAGIIHGNRGRQPANAKPNSLRQQVLSLHRKHFPKYNVCHFAEALAEEYHLKLNRETLRRWFRAAGIPPKRCHRLKTNHRRQRQRRAQFGELVFLDGSPHHWLGDNQPPLTLILATDDATGRPLYGRFFPQETLNGCLEVLYHLLTRFGRPRALYLDKASHFTTTRHGGVHVFQRDDQPTHFEIALRQLGIEAIFASSPQARGRGERINETFQDRLVAELDRHHIRDAQTATRYLNQSFIPRYARRFGVQPRNPKPAWEPIDKALELRTVLCAKAERTVTNDNTISYANSTYQLLPSNRTVPIAGSKVEVQEWFDGSIHFFHEQAGELRYSKLPPKPRPQLHMLCPRPRKRQTMPYDIFPVLQV